MKLDPWLGSAESFREALTLVERLDEAVAAGSAARVGGQASEAAGLDALPRLYSRHSNVGVVTVRGPLINAEESNFTRAFGVSNYPAIREALVFAASDESVDQILLDIESGGGQVSGVNDTANLIRQVRAAKPVTAFSGDLIASAAYWLGSAADKLYIDKTTIVGSIGVITTITSVHEALKKEGVEIKVMRAGKNKAPGHPAEPMSDKAIEIVQSRLDAVYDVFTETVMANRSSLKKDKKDEWAEGNEYIGFEAIGVGLADEMSSFDKVLAQLSVDNESSSDYISRHKNKRVVQMPRAALDPKILALVQAGAALSADQQALVDAAKVAADAEAAEAATAQATAQAAAEAEAAATAAAASAAATEAAKVEAAKSELVVYLQSQITALQAELATAKASLVAAAADLAAVKAPHAALVKIAADSVNVMLVALGGSKLVSIETLSGGEIVAKHAAVLGDFNKTFPTSAVAATAGAEPAKKKLAVVTPMHGNALAGIRDTVKGAK